MPPVWHGDIEGMISAARRWAVLAIALVIVLQSAAFAASASVPVVRDVFGNVICSFQPDGGDGSMPDHWPPCCVVGAAPGLAQPHSAPSSIEPRELRVLALLRPIAALRPVPVHVFGASSPRGPPPFV